VEENKIDLVFWNTGDRSVGEFGMSGSILFELHNMEIDPETKQEIIKSLSECLKENHDLFTDYSVHVDERHIFERSDEF